MTTREVVEAILVDEQQRNRLSTYAAARFGIHRGDAEDILQETALEMLKQRSYVRQPEAFVFTVFRARCARFIGQQISRRARRLVQASEAGANELRSLDRELAFREALSTISLGCQRLLRAYYMEGLSLFETASRLSMARKSVPKTLSRCLKKLRESLA